MSQTQVHPLPSLGNPKPLQPRRRLSMPVGPGFARLLVVLALLAAWEVAARLFGDKLFVASFTQTLGGLTNILVQTKVQLAILDAFIEIIVAYALAVIGGLILGLVIGLNRFVLETFRPLLMLIYATPQAPFLPFFIVFFGIGMTSKIAYGFTHGLFVIAVTVIAGVQSIDQSLMRAARSMGASRAQIMTEIVLPTMLRSFFTGARLGLTGVIIGVMLAELYVTSGGIGALTKLYAGNFTPQNLFALASVLAVIAVTLNELARRAERRASLWRGE